MPGGRKWENQTLVPNLTLSFRFVDYIWEFSDDATVLDSLKNSLTEDLRLQQHPALGMLAYEWKWIESH